MGNIVTIPQSERDPSRIVFALRQALERLQPPNSRTKLVGYPTVYVATTGNDTRNDGLSVTNPFLTIQAAVNYICNNVDIAGYLPTVKVADGTYGAGAFIANPLGTGTISSASGYIQITGNTTTPANVIINGPETIYGGLDAFYILGGDTQVSFDGLTITNATSGGDCIHSSGGLVRIGSNMRFGAVDQNHIDSDEAAQIILGGYTITGGGASHISSTVGGKVTSFGATVTVSGTPAFSTAFVYADNLGVVQDLNTWSGAITGTKLALHTGAVVSSANGFPGTGGTVDSDAQYNGATGNSHTVLTLSNGANSNIVISPTFPWSSQYARVVGPSGAFSISGFVAGIDGQRLTVQNAVAQDMTITNQATSSTSNQITTLTGADVTLTGVSVANFIYSIADTKWILTGTQG